MATVSASHLRKDIAAILKGANLDQLSSKKVRRQLEEKYDVDLTERKKEIDQLLMELIDEAEDENKKAKPQAPVKIEPSTAPVKHEANGSKPADDSEAKNEDEIKSESDSDFDMPEDYEPRKPKVKKESPKKKLDDEEYAKKLQEAENDQGGRSTRSGRKGCAKRKQTKPVKKPPKGTGYGQECELSPMLASVLGCSRMSRCDIVKQMWAIVKERELLDPKNKQFMICDDELYKLFKRKRIRMFAVMKYLTHHIFKPGEMEDMLR